MPTLNVTTNATVDRVAASDFVRAASSLVAKAVGKPEAYVMVCLRESQTMCFAGTEDPTAFVELDAYFKATMERGGSGERLVQTFTQHATHSYLSDPTYPTLMAALLRWVDTGEKPTPAGIAAQCPALEARFGQGCAFLPGYVPAALNRRVADRARP